MKKVFLSILLLCLTLCLFVGCSDEHDNPTPIDESLYTMKSGSEWFKTLTAGTNIQKTSITEIVFGKEIPQGKTEQDGINLTNKTDGKVKGYVVQDESNYKIYIVGDYIFGNSDCKLMFRFTSLSTLDLSNFDTSNVTNMESMFRGCSSLTSLDLSNFDTSKVIDMDGMFSGCTGLKSITFGSNFDTSNVTGMEYMFTRCSGLNSLDISNFDTSNVTTMRSMFQNCTGLKSITFGSNFHTSSVTNMSSMFSGCTSLTDLDLSNFDITTTTPNRESVPTTLDMFENVPTTTPIYVSKKSDWSSFSVWNLQVKN